MKGRVVANEIIAYREMCTREGEAQLQKGMNFGRGRKHSVLLMSRRRNAPYRDRHENDGEVLIYEGHNQPKSAKLRDPRLVNQPLSTPRGLMTENGHFDAAAKAYKLSQRAPERVRVYEKLFKGVWSYNGMFHLTDSWTEADENRQVCKFRLEAVEGEEDFASPVPTSPVRRRVIPSPVKLEVWSRDKGRCAKCGANDGLHFDHIIPFSKGGSSETAANVQILCERHNLEKSDSIE